MKRIGIRELQQNAAAVLREVRAVGRLEVTDRGRRVAWLVAATADDDELENLEAAGLLVRASKDLRGLEPPISLRRGQRRASAVLEAMRDAER